MPDEPDDSLIRDRGERIAASEAMRIGEASRDEDLSKVVRDAGVDVSRTINSPESAALAKAREAIAESRRRIDTLNRQCERARAAIAESKGLWRRRADILRKIRSVKE